MENHTQVLAARKDRTETFAMLLSETDLDANLIANSLYKPARPEAQMETPEYFSISRGSEGPTILS